MALARYRARPGLQADSPDEKMVLATLINLLDNDDGISEPQKRPAQQTALRFGPQTAADRQLQRYAM